MSSTGKSEYRERQEYRESYPGGGFHLSAGMAQALPYILIGLILVISMMMIGGWMFFRWWITDAWKAQWLGVLAVNTAIVCLIIYAVWWNIKVRYDRHEIWKRRQIAEIGVLEVQPRVIESQADKGFNTEIVESDGATVRTINPLSIAAASKETNNYYGYDGDEDDKGLPQIEAPKMVTLSELLADGSIQPREETSLIGFERADGSRLRGKLFAKTGNMFNSLFVVGDPDFGKSTMGTYLGVLTVIQGGKIIVIDPQAELEHSLTDRLGPLAKPPFCISHAGTPEEAKGAIKVARQELSQPGDYPVLLLIDEFSELQSGFGEWADIGSEVVAVAESFARTGRKLKRRTVVFGQISTAKRTGGTEFRNVCSTVAFHLKVQSAQNVLDEFDKLIAPTLAQGEIVLVPALQQSHTLRLPYPDKDGLTRVAEMMNGTSTGTYGTLEMERDEDDFWSPQSQTTIVIETDEMPVAVHDTGPLQNGTDEPVEPLGMGPIGSPDDLMMNDLQIRQFEILYKALGNIKECLRRIDGCNNRHHRHASSIVKQKNLRRL